MKIHFTGDTSEVLQGVGLLLNELNIELDEEGYPIHLVQRTGNIYISNENGQGEIGFDKKIHFFRALGLWLEYYKKQTDFEVVEEPQFEMCGGMLDASRNAVLSVNGIKKLLRRMAIMGLNSLMVYTEDTYEVNEYPYFGYMRGRYTVEELRMCDQYASKLGIEMIPCIQTLAHLKEAIKWNYASKIRDTADILLVGEPETYLFLENIIAAAAKPFSTNRIHIGMDEAHQLGLGKYLEKNGYENRFEIMNKHLKEVIAITEKLGLHPMIWSDMYFRLGSSTGDYYDPKASIPEEIIASIPDVQMVYWDYYHKDKEFYRSMIKKHRQLGKDIVFAGGVWTWNGIAPNYGKTWVTTEAGLMACKEEGVKEVFATMWGDNGAETPLFTALPGLQLYAEHAYHREVDQARVKERFAFCNGYQLEDFLLLKDFDETPGVMENNLLESSPSKFLLWQDILIGLYDENIKGLKMQQHYSELIPELEKVKEKELDMKRLFEFYEQLAIVLSKKAEMGIHLKEAYDRRDKEKVYSILNDMEILQKDVDELRKRHRTLWFSVNKPFGWEVLDIRYGGVLSRTETAKHRITQWLEGHISEIEELEAERLYYDGPWEMPEGTLGGNMYHRIVTASVFSG